MRSAKNRRAEVEIKCHESECRTLAQTSRVDRIKEALRLEIRESVNKAAEVVERITRASESAQPVRLVKVSR